MAACRFDSPSLVTSLSGTTATPTFAFDAANSEFFGLQGKFTSNNGAVCSFSNRPAITPVIVTSSGSFGRNTYCSILPQSSVSPIGSGSTTYNGIECPAITNSAFLPGTYTLAFWQEDGAPSISSQVFLIAVATTSTDVATRIYYESTTFPVETTSTTTLTSFTSTATWTASRSLSTTTTTIPITVTSTLTSCSSSSSSTTSVPSSTPTGLPTSKDGSCGASSGQTCLGSPFGNCCSRYGYCGSMNSYCLPSEGCQRGFGTCSSPPPISSSVKPSPTGKVSPDGSCGGAIGYICRPGTCCSKYGYCGSTSGHCSTGCQPAFGICEISSAPQPSPTLIVSPDGSCGQKSGQTCRGSTYGDCCSQYGFCGRASTYCFEGCQSGYGDCDETRKQPAPRPNGRMIHRDDLVRRELGGKGPDYTYPPIPRTTITTSITHKIIVFPSGVVGTTTVLDATTTTVGGVVTLTETTRMATRTATVCPTA